MMVLILPVAHPVYFIGAIVVVFFPPRRNTTRLVLQISWQCRALE
jgi:hypothetical protein